MDFDAANSLENERDSNEVPNSNIITVKSKKHFLENRRM